MHFTSYFIDVISSIGPKIPDFDTYVIIVIQTKTSVLSTYNTCEARDVYSPTGCKTPDTGDAAVDNMDYTVSLMFNNINNLCKTSISITLGTYILFV